MSTTDINAPSYGRANTPNRSWDDRGWSNHRDETEDPRDDGRRGHRYRRHDGPGVLRRGEAWLDDRGKGAWIVAMVLGFIFFWPVGLALLFYMIWSKRMFSSSCRSSRKSARYEGREMFNTARAAMRPSGNATFDAYKAATLRRLEEEQGSFEAFLERLREAKDKAEFDQFMEDRARAASEGTDDSRRDAPRDSDTSRAADEDRNRDDRSDRGNWTGGPAGSR